MTHSLRRYLGLSLACSFALLLSPPVRAADDAPAKEETREPVATVLSPSGTVLAATKKEPAVWQALKSKGEISSTDSIVALPGFKAQVGSADSAAEVTLWGNLPEFSNAPVFESAVIFHKDAAGGIEFTLLRGRVLLTGKGKGKGPAQARVRINDRVAYEIKLPDADSEVALEMIRRWPTGTPFTLTATARRAPQMLFSAVTVKGKAFIKAGGEQHLMESPAVFHVDNIVGPDAKPSRLPRVPAWVEGAATSAEARQMEAAVQRLQKRLEATAVDKALAESLAAENTSDRTLAVYSYAATNDLTHLADALSDAKRADVRAAAITALRHWLGQAPDNDVRLYTFLRKEWNYTAEQAEIVVQLLHGFRDSDRDRPETFETLIEYLRHRKRSVRELARWHLYRWVISGRSIPYDASASPEQLERAYKAWKTLIPDGKLPPAPPKEPK
jgi:hypothetical protein